MKTILLMSLCLLFTIGIQAQTAPKEEVVVQEVTKLMLGVEDAEGNIKEDVNVIDLNEIPLYCYIDLSSQKPTLVNMKLIAVKAKRLRPNARIVSVNYTTKQGESSVEFNASPRKIWAEGDYRVDIYLDGKLAKSKEFKVVKGGAKMNDNQTQN